MNKIIKQNSFFMTRDKDYFFNMVTPSNLSYYYEELEKGFIGKVRLHFAKTSFGRYLLYIYLQEKKIDYSFITPIYFETIEKILNNKKRNTHFKLFGIHTEKRKSGRTAIIYKTT